MKTLMSHGGGTPTFNPAGGTPGYAGGTPGTFSGGTP